jgi:hypothetical protein
MYPSVASVSTILLSTHPVHKPLRDATGDWGLGLVEVTSQADCLLWFAIWHVSLVTPVNSHPK